MVVHRYLYADLGLKLNHREEFKSHTIQNGTRRYSKGVKEELFRLHVN